jgi:hypothetical protein
MLKRISILTLVLAVALSLQAQYGTVKMNLPSLAFRNFSFLGEFGMNEKMSLNLGASFMLPYKNVKLDAGFAGVRSANSGFSLTPELRFYFAGVEDEGHGFYLGPYLRYSRYAASFNGMYYDSTLMAETEVEVSTSLQEIGIGVQLGYQLLLNERFVIDFFLIGPRISKYQFEASLAADLGETEIFDALGIPNLDENGFFGIGSYDLDISGSDARFIMPVYLPAFRIGLAVGYKF